MRTEPTHLFSVQGDTLTPTDLVRGPWDHGLQHGGAVCGALGWAVADAVRKMADGSEFVLCRQTTELLRPVPAEALRYKTSIDRSGRRSRVVSASLLHGDRLVARTSSQWARVQGTEPQPLVADPTDRLDSAVPLRPVAVTDPGQSDFNYPRPGFNCDVFEFRSLSGTTEDPGPGVAWVRMIPQLVDGEPNSPVHVLATVSDLGNAIGWARSPAGEPMVNSDVTLQLLRYPEGEWVCLQSRSRSTWAGIGMMETKLWDGDGQFGRVLSSTMESPMPLAADPPSGALQLDE